MLTTAEKQSALCQEDPDEKLSIDLVEREQHREFDKRCSERRQATRCER